MSEPSSSPQEADTLSQEKPSKREHIRATLSSNRYANFMATLSMLVSLLTFVHTCRSDVPNVAVRELKKRTYLHCNMGASKWEVWSLLTFQIDNTGNTTTSLTGIHQRKKINPVLASSSGAQFPVPSVLYVPNLLDQETLDAATPRLTEELSKGENITPKFLNFETQPSSLSVPIFGEIESRVPAKITLGLMTDTEYKGAPIERVELHLNFSFSHGKSHSVTALIDTPSTERGKCPPER